MGKAFRRLRFCSSLLILKGSENRLGTLTQSACLFRPSGALPFGSVSRFGDKTGRKAIPDIHADLVRFSPSIFH